MVFYCHNLSPCQLLIAEKGRAQGDSWALCFLRTVLNTPCFRPLSSAPSTPSGDAFAVPEQWNSGMVVWVLFFTPLHPGYRSLPWTEICAHYHRIHAIVTAPLLISPQESIFSHLTGSPVPRHLHSCTGPGPIFYLQFTANFLICSLSGAFPGSPLRGEEPVWSSWGWLKRCTLGTEQAQAVPVMQVQFPSGNSSSVPSQLPSSSKEQVSASRSKLFLLPSYIMDVSAEAIKVTSLQHFNSPIGF